MYRFDSGQEWWRHAVIYQILVPSFQDSDGDGWGDLRGVLSRLDHLAWLGVDAVWLTPIYATPMLDAGYDVSDHCAIDERFGSLPVFRELVSELHARGMRLVLDFIPNHTSDVHPWFQSSRISTRRPHGRRRCERTGSAQGELEHRGGGGSRDPLQEERVDGLG